MNYPSVKDIRKAFARDLKRGDATRIRRLMADSNQSVHSRMVAIDRILGTHGVEYIPKGHNDRSPAIDYCNTGDTYGTTIMHVNGRFTIGDWGYYVERGSYD